LVVVAVVVVVVVEVVVVVPLIGVGLEVYPGRVVLMEESL